MLLSVKNFLHNFFEFLLNFFRHIKIALAENVEIFSLVYLTFRYLIFEKKWTFFRFLKVWIGWCLGILPLYYFTYIILILIFMFMNLFFSIIEGFFLFYFLKYFSNKVRWDNNYLIFKKFSDWFLEDLFDKYPNYLIAQFNFYFSWDYFWTIFFKYLTKVDYFLYRVVVYLEWWLRWVFWEKLKNIVLKSIRLTRYYFYVFRFICKKLRKRRNWVILYYDLKKVKPIFKWLFFYMSFVGERHRLEAFFIRKKAKFLYYFWINNLSICIFLFIFYCIFKIFILYLFLVV